MAISRMQEPQQIQRGLGSLDVPRQKYGLGKLVKKAVRGVKKIVKSPLGKAAILGGLGMYGMGAGPFSGMKGAGFLRGLMGARNAAASSKFLYSPLHGKLPASVYKRGFLGNMLGGAKNWWGGLSGGQKLFTGLAGASLAAPFLMGKGDEEEDVVEEAWTSVPSSIADIRNQARAHYTNPSASTLAFMPGKQFVAQNFYAADGGRAGLMNGGEPGQEQIEQMLMAEFVKYKNQGGTLTFEQFVEAIMQAQQEGQGMEQPQEVAMAANGGRIGFKSGTQKDDYKVTYKSVSEGGPEGWRTHDSFYDNFGKYITPYWYMEKLLENIKTKKADGGRIGALNGGLMSEDEDEYSYNPQAAMRMYKRSGKQEGGIMETEEASEMIDLGGKEKDYRETGGFVDLGRKERADDVPARLSKNEFVFTADAVRAAGGGDIDKGSEVMQNLMDNLEAGGEVSEESQGLEGAQAMYDQQQMLQSRMI